MLFVDADEHFFCVGGATKLHGGELLEPIWPLPPASVPRICSTMTFTMMFSAAQKFKTHKSASAGECRQQAEPDRTAFAPRSPHTHTARK